MVTLLQNYYSCAVHIVYTAAKESVVNNAQFLILGKWQFKLCFHLRARSDTRKVMRRLLAKKKPTTYFCCVGSRTEI